jgi:2,3-dihydro-2,3-dihydroxybenzoate dehydrogenase
VSSVHHPAVVIGGARGIGKAIAIQLADQPWVSEVVVADLMLEQAEETAAEIRTLGRAARAKAVDLAETGSVEQLVSDTPGTRYLVVAAGIFDSGPSLEVDAASFRRVLEVNLVGTFHAVQQYAAQMVDAGEGSIVTVASIAARMPRLRQAAYCASKAGIRQALRVLALETTPAGVRINFVSPGPTDTEMMRQMAQGHPHIDDLAQGSLESFRPRVPRGVVARPPEIASAVTFLLSPSASHITFQDLVVDGGELLGV